MAPQLRVQDALARVTAGIEPLEAETVPLEEACGRVLAQNATARLTQPPFDSSAMDGYAVRAADLGTLPCELQVIGDAAAGHPFDRSVGARQAVRIFTGAPVPEGADTVVIQENTERAGDTVTVREAGKKGNFVRPRGFDFEEGQALLEAGRRLGARDLALAAAMNLKQLTVQRRPVVAILATGDELVMPGEDPGAGQIISSIPFGLVPLIERAGGAPRRLGIAGDTSESLAAHIAEGKDADILVTIGGASVGEHDLVQGALEAAGMSLDFWKIAMRPGKPLMFGRLGRQRVLGVPGNPVSAFICTRLFLVPMLRAMLSLPEESAMSRTGVLQQDLPANGPRQHYMRATLKPGSGGETLVRPARSQDSSLLSPLADADCLIVRPPHAKAAGKGEAVPILLLDF